jgi:hypothetical protein
VGGNVADAYGRGGAISVLAGAVVTDDNRVTSATRAEAILPAVQVRARSAVVGANHVTVTRRQLAIAIDAGPCTVLGNVTNGPIELNGAALGPPWDALNA